MGERDLAGPRRASRRRPGRTARSCGAARERALARRAAVAEARRRCGSRVISIASLERRAAAGSRAGGGRASSCRRPGGPTISRLCPPAAAISSARLASAWPRTSARSGAVGRRPRLRRTRRTGRPAAPLARARPWRSSDGTPEHLDAVRPAPPRRRSRPARSAARSPARPRRRPRSPRPREPAAARRSSDSSPQTAQRAERRPSGTWPLAASSATASARSKLGAGLAQVRGREVRREPLQRELEPEFRSAARTRSRASRTAASGRPDDREHGQPAPDVDLDRHLAAVDAFDGECGDAGEHAGYATAAPAAAPCVTNVTGVAPARVTRRRASGPRRTCHRPVANVYVRNACCYAEPPTVRARVVRSRTSALASSRRTGTSSSAATRSSHATSAPGSGELDLVGPRARARLLRGQDAGGASVGTRAPGGPLDAIGPAKRRRLRRSRASGWPATSACRRPDG